MLKAFGRLWLKSAKRLAKAQVAQQKKLQKKLVKRALASVKKPAATVKRRSTAALRSTPLGIKSDEKKSLQQSAPLSEGGTWSRAYYSSREGDARTRIRRLTYWLFVPFRIGVVDGASLHPLPLVVMLHGCEQTAPDFARGTRMNQLAARHGFAVLYPQQAVSAHPQRCWPWYRRSLQQGGDEIALIAGATEKVIARFGFDRSRVYVAGLSAGAALAQIMALRHPRLIAAVASHSGPVYGVADSRMRAFAVMQQGSHDPSRPITELLDEQPDFPPMPMLIVQGEHDHTVRLVNALQLARQFCLLNRMPVAGITAPVQRPARGSCDAYRTTDYRIGTRTLVRLCEVAHLAHAWSGGDATLRYNAALGPDASALLWQFFKRYRRLQK